MQLAVSCLLLVAWLIWNIMATSAELQSRRHHWTRAENEELMLCYYAAEPSVHGFLSDFMICGTSEMVTTPSIQHLMSRDSVDKFVLYSYVSIFQILS